MNYCLEEKITFEDYVLMNRRFARKYWVILSVIIVLCVLASGDWSLLSFGIKLLIIALVAIMLRLFGRKHFEKGLRKSFESNRALQHVQTFDFQGSTLTVSSDISQFKVTKDLVYKLTYFDDAIYLYLSKHQIYILKKSSLKNGSWSEFTAYLKANFDPKFKGK